MSTTAALVAASASPRMLAAGGAGQPFRRCDFVPLFPSALSFNTPHIILPYGPVRTSQDHAEAAATAASSQSVPKTAQRSAS